MALPLTKLTQKNIAFKWDQQCHECFEELTAVTTAPVLQLFQADNAEELEFRTDASLYAMGAALQKKLLDDRSLYLVAFFSYKMRQAQQNYSEIDREMLAIVKTLRFWRHLLHGLEFKVRNRP